MYTLFVYILKYFNEIFIEFFVIIVIIWNSM